MCTEDSYVCGLHFDGSNRPTKEDLDPILNLTNYSRPVLFQN